MGFWKGYAIAALISGVSFIIRLLVEGEEFWKELDHRLLHQLGYNRITNFHRFVAFAAAFAIVILAPPLGIVLNVANIYLWVTSESEDD
jgi:hypothetical protein